MSGTVLSDVYVSIYLIVTTLLDKYHYPHFTGGKLRPREVTAPTNMVQLELVSEGAHVRPQTPHCSPAHHCHSVNTC